MPKVLITTVPFAEKNRLPLELLGSVGVEYVINPLGRKLTEDELVDMIDDVDILIAGTEPITKKSFKLCATAKAHFSCRDWSGQC
jgi:D-3-phosphoglycerate dehydrogenase